MEKFVSLFLEDLKKIKNISSNTESSYRRDLNALLAFLSGKGIKDLSLVKSEDLASYISFLEANGKKASTISRMIASMHSFFDYLFKNGVITSDVSEEIKAPKIEKKDPKLLEVEEIVKLLSQPDVKNPKGLRDKAMLELVCSAGLRVSEVISLTEKDIDMDQRFVQCSDHKSVKIISYGKDAARAISEYIKSGRKFLVKNNEDLDVLFPNCYCKPMSRQGFWKMIKEYAQKAHITNEITTHTLRNYYLYNSKTTV